MTTLCFDFGNTRLKCAVFLNGHLNELLVLENILPETIQQLVNKYHPERTILSSVIEHDSFIETYLAEHSSFHKLTNETKLPFTTPVAKPQTIGPDRLAMVAAAVHKFPGKHNLVIGLGSCITYNFVTGSHEFIGGSISPGMEMRFKSLEHYTAKLPLIKADQNFPIMGYDTKTNIQSGVLLGIAKEIDGFIDIYKERYNNFNVHLTGGDVAFFGSLIKNEIFADPFLIYKGLYAICEYNQ